MSILIPAGTAEFLASGFFSPGQPKPLAICGLFKFNQFSSSSFVFSDIVAAESGTTYLSARFYHDGSANNYRRLSARIYDGTVGVNADAALGTASDSADVWIPFVAVHTSNSLRTIYTLDVNGDVVTAENTGSYSLPDAQDLVIKGLSEADMRLFAPSFYANDLTAAQAEEFLRTAAIDGLTPYVAWDTENDWGTGDILDVSGNNRHITPPAGWSYSTDNPEFGPQLSITDPIIPGTATSVTSTDFVDPPTGARITDGTNTIEITYDDVAGTVAPPALATQSYVLFGDVTLELYNATESATATVAFNPPASHQYLVTLPATPSNLTNTGYLFNWSPDNGYEGVQVIAPFEIDANGNIVLAPSDGVYTLYSIDDFDGEMQGFTVTVQDGEVVSDGRFTRRNLTRRTFTRRSLTARP